MTAWKWGKTAEWHETRRKGIGGSDATTLMTGDPAAIRNLWELKLGLRQPDDLSDVLPVQIGIATEDLHAAWYERQTGNAVIDRNRSFSSDKFDFLRCEVDGIIDLPGGAAVAEFKHVNAFSNIDEVAQRYMAQIHHEMYCTNLKRAVLSVFVGTLKYDHFIVEADPFYTATLLENETAFWAHVQNKTPPGELATIATPQAGPVKLRTVNMLGSNAWATNAGDWLDHRDGAKAFERAGKELKALVEPDVGEAFANGVKIKRARNGNLSITEMKL